MITNINNKYKDRSPEETIKIIKDFFIHKGYDVFVEKEYSPVIGIWWCHIVLKYNDIIIKESNGKGCTELFALASGYSELYERYCCLEMVSYYSILSRQKIFSNIQKIRNYYFTPEEKIMTFNEAINSSPKIAQFCNNIDDNVNSFKKTFDLLFPNGLIGIPFKSFLNDNQQLYLPITLIRLIFGSDGMSAGNSLEEALTQSLSELCEHYVHKQIYFDNEFFHILDINKLNISNYLKDIYNEITKNGMYKIKIFDFSYNYDLPVVGVLIVDIYDKIAYLNLGSAPVFDIALERCFTEIYQGYEKFHGDWQKTIMIPERIKDTLMSFTSTLSSITTSGNYPDNIFINYIEELDYNHNIFLNNNNYSNLELNEYYKKLFNQKKWDVYYYNFSLLDNFYAIQSFINNVDTYGQSSLIEYNDLKNRKQNWLLCIKINQLIKQYFETQILDINLLIEILKLYDNIPKIKFHKDIFCFCINILQLLPIKGMTPNTLLNLIELYQDKQKYILNSNMFSTLPKYIKNKIFNYNLLFLSSNQYSDQEIQNLSALYDIKYSKIDFENKKNIYYFIENTIFKPSYDYYNSNEYNQLINTLIPNN